MKKIKAKKYYIIPRIEKRREIRLKDYFRDKFETKIDLTWADGMVGVAPIFSNKRKAMKYAKGSGLIEVEEVLKG